MQIQGVEMGWDGMGEEGRNGVEKERNADGMVEEQRRNEVELKLWKHDIDYTDQHTSLHTILFFNIYDFHLNPFHMSCF